MCDKRFSGCVKVVTKEKIENIVHANITEPRTNLVKKFNELDSTHAISCNGAFNSGFSFEEFSSSYSDVEFIQKAGFSLRYDQAIDAGS